MLRSLAIRQFTIIDRLELEFGDGFGAITGETGAGKSILIDALAQLLGERGDSTLVASGADKADLTATFEPAADHPAHAWLAQQELADESIVVLRRTLPADGASRAWINGQPVAIAQLRQLGALLVEIHGQHQHQQLERPQAQRELLDRHLDPAVLERVRTTAAAHETLQQQLAELDALAGKPAEAELLRFQLEELETLGLAAGEFEALELEQRRLGSVDELTHAIEQALEALEGESAAAGAQVHAASRALTPLTRQEPELAEALDMLASAAVNIEEAARALHRLGDDLEHDPERLAAVENRLARALELARKHRVTAPELPQLSADLGERLARIEGHEDERRKLEAALATAEQTWREHAAQLSQARQSTAVTLAERCATALAELGMDQARVVFEVRPDPEATVARHGSDRVEILFSANPGQPPRALARIASGGELSRFSLGLIIAGADAGTGRVRIFDEIDAGVGGETAHAVGRFLKRAAAGGQAFCVTHLAQVAAAADQQWRVVKQQDGKSTQVRVEALDRAGRVTELARMLGSAESTTSRRHAKAMLDSGAAS
ncbi:MAG: DNA repair protein RecN [Wenzhouxiangellaceae bacterium]|nr:DNA repair protein RecN [Wenzhouxiangellaceae bacterium]